MPKRQARVKLSKAQILENDTNKWLAKKAAAIEMLMKAMEHLKQLERSSRRLSKREIAEAQRKSMESALHPEQKKIADKLNAATKRKRKEVTDIPVTEPPIADVLPEDREARMKAMGFRPTRKRRAGKTDQPVVSG
jgi:hypothetical protein